ncbi:MAG: helix-turn-helix domain protein [Bacteroidetes bacterium]|nr:helix-turn-helix domain protein [Bacteroidota bacterium]
MRIKEAIEDYNLTSKEVAERMGISTVGLSQHINGNPSVKTLERIAEAIGCNVSEFFIKKSNTNCPHCGKPITIEIKKTP